MATPTGEWVPYGGDLGALPREPHDRYDRYGAYAPVAQAQGDGLVPSTPPPEPPDVASTPISDLVIVVAAGGGVGRSTTADLLARRLCATGPLVLIDDAPGLFSLRRTLVRGPDGLALLPGYGGEYHVLAPNGPLARVDTASVVANADPGWTTLVVDSYDSVLILLHAEHWFRLLTEPGVRVLLVTPSATGPLQQAITAARALRQAGVAPEDLVAAVVDISEGRLPRPVRARMVMLDGEVGAITRVPHLPSVRAMGRLEAGHGGRDAERAADALVRRLALEYAA
ncbi:CobQ/CobB/MinD/ParA nucleotide binding domain-containing protein [Frankia sp. AiPs1]|uniref:hypothetical protein n=1 Tax=Frankia sp. AiPa1 TaxID=573492 RepID=UPI00202B89BF|nr:hypothetical protein [Frankia sp. AiPa1]MCL9760367.1 hypothetical protein [Frankia sp. AiPa1]